MPSIRRVPKLKGFSNPNRVEYAPVNVEVLATYFDDEVTPEALYGHGSPTRAPRSRCSPAASSTRS